MERIVERNNVRQALKRVKQNKGSPGIDGMAVEDLPAYLNENREALRAKLLGGTYQPTPVCEREIPKSGGGVRKLGIPTALDRVIQQAITSNRDAYHPLGRTGSPTLSALTSNLRTAGCGPACPVVWQGC